MLLSNEEIYFTYEISWLQPWYFIRYYIDIVKVGAFLSESYLFNLALKMAKLYFIKYRLQSIRIIVFKQSDHETNSLPISRLG